MASSQKPLCISVMSVVGLFVLMSAPLLSEGQVLAGAALLAPPNTIQYSCVKNAAGKPVGKVVGEWVVNPPDCVVGQSYTLTLGYPTAGQAFYLKNNQTMTGYIYGVKPVEKYPYWVVNHNGSHLVEPGQDNKSWRFTQANIAYCASHCDFVLR